MYYNGNYAEYSYKFNPNHACSLFERLAYELLHYLTKDEENVEFVVHSKMYANGEFYYSMKAYNENEDTALCYYSLENFNKGYSEDIHEDGILTYHKGQHNQYALVWNKNFFGLDHIMYNEELVKTLEDYRLC